MWFQVDTTGEAVIAQFMPVPATQGEIYATNEKLQRGLHEPARDSSGPRIAALPARIQPMPFVSGRLTEVVRDLARKLNKRVEIKLIGDSSGIDKNVTGKISDLLIRLVSNSITYGIETPEERAGMGKNPCGTLTLRAYHQGGIMTIEVSDDGCGLGRVKILERARERGMVRNELMSNREVYALIMEPGFYNDGEVTNFPWYGAGIAGVSRFVAELGGHIELDSVEGRGSRVSIRLPLAPATLDGWSVQVGRETYIVPLNAIIEFIPGKTAKLEAVAGGYLLRARDEYIPIIALHGIFNTCAPITDPELGILIVLEARGRKIALLVDDLLAQHQVALKNPGIDLCKVSYISGATVLGNGLVVFILDAGELVRHGHAAVIDAPVPV